MANIFLLGAGFSHAVSNKKAPLTSQLMDEITDVIPYELEQEFYYYRDNIESFITALDLRIISSELPNIKNKFNDIRKTIVDRIIKLLDITKIRDDTCKTGDRFLEAVKPSDTILTLNYDCLIDSLLSDKKIWSPKGGYSEFIDVHPGCELDNDKNILLLKLHGSVNFWSAAPWGKGGWDETKKYITAELTGVLFRNSGIGDLGVIKKAKRGEYVIIPTYVKIYHWQIIRLWKLSIEKMQQTVNLTIMGCSLREEDTMLNVLLSFFKGENIYIIDKNADAIAAKILKLTGKSAIKYNGEFNEEILEKYLEESGRHNS